LPNAFYPLVIPGTSFGVKPGHTIFRWTARGSNAVAKSKLTGRGRSTAAFAILHEEVSRFTCGHVLAIFPAKGAWFCRFARPEVCSISWTIVRAGSVTYVTPGVSASFHAVSAVILDTDLVDTVGIPDTDRACRKGVATHLLGSDSDEVTLLTTCLDWVSFCGRGQ
jgi:hypothetical protein